MEEQKEINMRINEVQKNKKGNKNNIVQNVTQKEKYECLEQLKSMEANHSKKKI